MGREPALQTGTLPEKVRDHLLEMNHFAARSIGKWQRPPGRAAGLGVELSTLYDQGQSPPGAQVTWTSRAAPA